VPVIRIFFRFGVRDAVTISNCSIVVAGFMRFVFNINKPHPYKFDLFNKPAGTIVYFDLCILMLPALIMGSTVGVILGMLLPEPVITIFLTFCLIYIVSAMGQRLMIVLKDEN
jgi:uncharacterized membrane protein YfcA